MYIYVSDLLTLVILITLAYIILLCIALFIVYYIIRLKASADYKLHAISNIQYNVYKAFINP